LMVEGAAISHLTPYLTPCALLSIVSNAPSGLRG
jgi:hypothetical protein